MAPLHSLRRLLDRDEAFARKPSKCETVGQTWPNVEESLRLIPWPVSESPAAKPPPATLRQSPPGRLRTPWRFKSSHPHEAKTRRLVGHVLDTRRALVTGTAEHFVHPLTRDSECTRKLGLGGARLVRGEQGAAKIPAGSVKTLKRVECFPVCAQHSLDFGVVCDGRTISQRGCLPLARQG
jgi:hypothetical protein